MQKDAWTTSRVVRPLASFCRAICGTALAALTLRPAYHELKHEIEDFQQARTASQHSARKNLQGLSCDVQKVLPLLMELSKKSIQQRHWQQALQLWIDCSACLSVWQFDLTGTGN